MFRSRDGLTDNVLGQEGLWIFLEMMFLFISNFKFLLAIMLLNPNFVIRIAISNYVLNLIYVN